MFTKPSEGVVDGNLHSHDHSNLYLCGWMCVSKSPEKHLTLTLMALAHRLADHLVANRFS